MEGNQALCIFCCRKVNRGSSVEYEEPDEEILERFIHFTDRKFNCVDKKYSSVSNTKELSKSSSACLKCFGIIEYYCNLYHQIECLQLQLNCQLKKVWKIMNYADRIPARVKAFREWCNGNGLISPIDTGVDVEDPTFGGPIKFRQTFKRRCKLYLGRRSPRLHISKYHPESKIKNDLGESNEQHLHVDHNSIPGVPPAILEISESPPPPSPHSTSRPIIIRVINRQSTGFAGNTNTQRQNLKQSLNMYSEESNSHSYSDGYEDDYDEPVAKHRRIKLEGGSGIPSLSVSRGGGAGNRAKHHRRPSSSNGCYLNGGDPMDSDHQYPPFSLGTLINPESESSLQDSLNLSPESSGAYQNNHDGGGGGAPSASDLEEFSRYFKRRRIKFGYSQADVGVAMSSIYGDAFSQTTISRFEALQLSYKNLCKLQPVMQKWLKEVETGMTPTIDKDAAPMFKKRKKRTNIPPHKKSSLENYFRQDSKPSGEEILAIANALELEKDVVRVWFCNRRQKENNQDSVGPQGTDTNEEQSYMNDSTDPLFEYAGEVEGEPQNETSSLNRSKVNLVVKEEPIEHSEGEAAIMVM